jgi:D-3-phosphoglycerate dehydrogenase
MMPKLKVFLTYTDEEFESYYSATGLAALLVHADVVRNTSGRVLEGTDLAAAAAGCQVIIAHRSSSGNAALFANAPDLVAFLRGAVDISTIDVGASSSNGILVTHATAGFGPAVAELAIGMMFDLARGISRARAVYCRGEEPVMPKALQLGGSTVGILGFGRIGRSLAALAQGIGMNVKVNDPQVPAAELGALSASFDDVIAQSDFVVCLAASTPETRGLISQSVFAAMKPGACFLNLSRGELVDEDALEQALDRGHLRGAGIDVGSAPDQKPHRRFWNRPDCVVMPHVGGMTFQAREHQTMDTVRQVAALAAGTMPDYAVNAESAWRVQRLFSERAVNQ